MFFITNWEHNNVSRVQDGEVILETTKYEPQISPRSLSRCSVSQSKLQELLPQDSHQQVAFCQFILDQDINFHFHFHFLFTDKACFTPRGITNVYNYHH